MAKGSTAAKTQKTNHNPKQKRTSIGRSKNSRPKNKHKRRNSGGKYRGQGR